MNKTIIDITDFIFDLSDVSKNLFKQGQEIMICIANDGMVSTLFGKLRDVETFTNWCNITLENGSGLTIWYDQVERVEQEKELTRNNTLKTKVILLNGTILEFEYEVKIK